MNIKSKLTLAIGILVAMIVLLVVLSVVNLQILTATEPDSPAAGPGLQRALLWISVKTHAKLANMSVEERDKAIDKLSEENAKYLLKIAYKAMFNPRSL